MNKLFTFLARQCMTKDRCFVTEHFLCVRANVTVTVTEALVLRPLLEDRGRITESVRILVTVNRMEKKCFQITTKRVC